MAYPKKLSIGDNTSTLGVEPFFEGTENVYYSLVVIGKRANQIGQEVKAELNEKLAEFGPTGDTLEEITENREQVEIAKKYEAMPKPTLMAVEEFLKGAIYYRNDSDLGLE